MLYVADVLRRAGARLAVPLLPLAIVLLPTAARQASGSGIDGCRPDPGGIVCLYSGTTTSTSPSTSSPPLRYLAVSNGRCWYWSAYPPGLDSWDSANDQAIITTRFSLPECAGRVTTVTVSSAAWEIFRRFPLPPPRALVTPDPGITNLPSRLHLSPPPEFSHREVLPDGRSLEVTARVERVWVDWGDGAPLGRFDRSAAVGDPGSARHVYTLKTCPPAYRTSSLHGPKCHPHLTAYPITVTLEWVGRYRDGGPWITLGSIDTETAIRHDVDEVLGVLTRP